MARKKKFKISQKTIEQNLPYAVGGVAALAANPVVDPMLGTNGWIVGGAKVVAGMIGLGMGGKYATGFGVTMAAYGAGQLVNQALQSLEMDPIAGLPVPTAPGVEGFDPRFLGTSETVEPLIRVA